MRRVLPLVVIWFFFNDILVKSDYLFSKAMGDIMEVKKLLSPNQIALGSFWGGPIAAVYYLRQNYLAMGKGEYAQKTLTYGMLLIVSLLGLLPFLPEQFPNMLLPLMYSVCAKQVAITTQLEKKNIEESEEYTFESNWNIFGVGILTLLLFCALALMVIFMLESLGLLILVE